MEDEDGGNADLEGSEPAQLPPSPVQDPPPVADPEDACLATLDPYLCSFMGDEDDTPMDITIEDMQVFLNSGDGENPGASSLPDMKEAWQKYVHQWIVNHQPSTSK